MKFNPLLYSDELHRSLTNSIDEANLPKVYQKTIAKEKEIPIVSKQEKETPSADITTSEAAVAPVSDVPVVTKEAAVITEEPITTTSITKNEEPTASTIDAVDATPVATDATTATATTTTTTSTTTA